jgi:anaerobic ribonucleoside-triphosphate reductase activating protein
MFREKFPDKNVWCYTGFTIEQILGKSEPKSRAVTDVSNEMLSLIDVLVDGPYVDSLHNISLKFRGSSNQRVIDMKKTLQQRKIILYLE